MPTLQSLFHSLQAQMTAQLQTNRLHISHPTTKGDTLENAWIQWLTTYLPHRYQVAKAHIIDHTGATSDQMDIVIYDKQYSPFIFSQDGATYIPAESVYAVFEVKQEISKKLLGYAADKMQSVRRLHRTTATIHDFKGAQQPKQLHNILGGFIALGSGWKGPMARHLAIAASSFTPGQQIHIGCVLEAGSFAIQYPNSMPPAITHSATDETLIFFFLKLLQQLQKLGTVPAIEIDKYAQSLKAF